MFAQIRWPSKAGALPQSGIAEIKPGGAQGPWTENLGVQITVLAALVLAAYWNSFGSSFHFDDNLFLHDPVVTGPGFGWGVFRLARSRPLANLTLHWNYLTSGLDPRAYYWTNLILHASNSIYVLLIARRQLSARASWLAAALFAIHPLQVESVAYVWSRATLLCTFFALLSFGFFLEEKYAGSAAAYALSLLAKEETVALPVFLLLYDLFQRKRRPRWSYYAGLVALAGLSSAHLFYEVGKKDVPSVGFQVRNVSILAYALTQARVVWIYLRLYLFPVGLNIDHDVPRSVGLLSPPTTLLALLALALTLGVLVGWTVRGSRPALWTLGFFLLLAPSSSLVPVADMIFEHRTYFPLAFLVVATAWLLASIPRRTLVPVLPLLLAALLAGTILRNRTWHDEKTLWTDALEKSPKKARSHLFLALAYMNDDFLSPRSQSLVQEGLRFDPDDPWLHVLMGTIFMRHNDPKEALLHFERALALNGETPDGWNSLSAAYLRLGQNDRALMASQRALQLGPCEPQLRMNLMVVLRMAGKLDELRRVEEVPGACDPSPAELRKLADFARSLK